MREGKGVGRGREDEGGWVGERRSGERERGEGWEEEEVGEGGSTLGLLTQVAWPGLSPVAS